MIGLGRATVQEPGAWNATSRDHLALTDSYL
jgi:hypothetical protein